MCKLLIFGGTTEGRQLAEYCAQKHIRADVSVATEYGASLLPEGVGTICGKLDCSEMAKLINSKDYSLVIDATHPYAIEATQNIKTACKNTDTAYIRLMRKKADLLGRTVKDIDEMIQVLNNSDSIILSTLGSKSLHDLTHIKDYHSRIWIRVLPSDSILEQALKLGYAPEKIIQEKGPFTIEQNIAHLKKSGAEILITKESGNAGGYMEKAEAARINGTEIITLTRPDEQGRSYDEVIDIINKAVKA